MLPFFCFLAIRFCSLAVRKSHVLEGGGGGARCSVDLSLLFDTDSVLDRTMSVALIWDAQTNWTENFEMHNQMMPFEEPQTVMYFS